ncbi:hypothetical protein B9G49_14590 [Halorubrum sp. SD683]|nr:hypothetical protein B9G49_14590 [Halorubrum sp. SD683]OYR77443.1 hypothetical protein DJ77_05220 [Halorubrum ezzemoulense]
MSYHVDPDSISLYRGRYSINRVETFTVVPESSVIVMLYASLVRSVPAGSGGLIVNVLVR